MASRYDYEQFFTDKSSNKVGTIESMLSGIASGLIAIPKGFLFFGCKSHGSWC